MGENLRPYIPSPHLRATEEGCRNELARAHSVESGVTVDSSREALSPDSSLLTQWTEDKHNSYLVSLERSFVERLQHSRRLRGWLSRQDTMGSCQPNELPAVNCDSSEQFVVVQNGCRRRMSFKRNEQRLESTSGYQGVVASQWLCHFSAGGFCVTTPLDPLQKSNPGMRGTQNLTWSSKLQSSSREHLACHLLHPDVAGDMAEHSDQNFEDEKEVERLCCPPFAKRMRMSTIDDPNCDQVVHLGLPDEGDTSYSGNISIDREEQGSCGLLSEQPETFTSRKSDIHYFLRGS